MKLKAETQVGIVVFVGIVTLVVVYWFLGGLGLRATMYGIYAVFDNAQKLQRGSDVRMSGVKIGLVADTRLTKDAKARVDMLINNDVAIPVDSVARITTGSFIGEYYVEIEPGKSKKMVKRSARIRTRSTITPDELIEGASEALQTLQTSLNRLNSLFAGEKLPGLIEDTVESLNKAASSTADLVSSMQALVHRVSPEIYATIRNARNATASAAEVGTVARDMVREDIRPKIAALLRSTEALLRDIDAVVGDAQKVIEDYKGSGAQLGNTLEKAQTALQTINEAAVQVKEMLTKLNEASSTIKELATDESVKADIRKTIRNVSEVSDQLKQTVEAISKRLGPSVGPSPELVKRVPEYGFTVNALANTSKGESRFDSYYTFIRNNEFYRIGGYDIGENTKLIAQGGSLLGQRVSLRYGIYASRIGLGWDYRFGQRGLFSTDFYRPNDLQAEVRGTVQIRDWLRFYIGTNDLLHRENRDLIVGVQYRK
ncbi:MAG: MlaD family protein [Armatimonadota bacterium]|nr:MlaD family protein [Armatimonadota bacterium]